MRNLKILLALLFCIGYLNSIAQDDHEKLINEFTSDDWKLVKQAKESLENLEEKAIPLVLPLLDDERIIKLKNTGTLIYPGAEKFFGYGQIVEYNIDMIAIRAGWLIEEISFNNFGFSGCHLPDAELVSFIKITFPDYYNNSTNRRKIETSTAEELQRLILKLSIRNAKEWWDNEKDTWTRLQALVDALQSFDEKRQVKALFYIRNGTTACTGLTKDFYIDNISKEIVRMSSSDTKRISEHARFILFDTKFEWLDNKKQKE